MITEKYVLEHCMHNSDEVLEKVFFPQFQHELDKITSPVNSGGYQSAVRHIEPMTFEEWKVMRYVEFRQARYLPIQEQLDMFYHDRIDGTTSQFDHAQAVKRAYPKPI